MNGRFNNEGLFLPNNSLKKINVNGKLLVLIEKRDVCVFDLNLRGYCKF